MTEFSRFRLAAIQAEPAYFDRTASVEKACHLIHEAGNRGATLAAFGESWLPGYPFFVWGEATQDMASEYVAQAVEIPGPTTDRLCDAARKTGIDVVIGVAERDRTTQGTVYCTLLFIGGNGEIIGSHRKLKPTHRERLAWGEGDGSSLITYQRSYARISGLNCWEHNMVLPGYALMAQGTQIHIAAWPGMSSSRHLFLSRAFASQAGAYVIDVGSLLSPEAVPAPYRGLASPYPGESCIIDPRGEIIGGPFESEGILIAEGSTERIFSAKTYCDTAGHYARPDVFQLRINRTRNHGLVIVNEEGYEASIEADDSVSNPATGDCAEQPGN